LADQIAAPIALHNLRQIKLHFSSYDRSFRGNLPTQKWEDKLITKAIELAQRWMHVLPSLECFSVRVIYPGNDTNVLCAWDKDRKQLRQLSADEYSDICSRIRSDIVGESDDEDMDG
jgi:hypothetical protein